MLSQLQRLILLNLVILSTNVNADIITDGTLGTQVRLTGPNFQIDSKIDSKLGEQHGNNWFHSFRQFDIRSGETATFSGPDNINNIITRVTGGQESYIDGTLRSTIPGANFYLLNPAGILFGKDAKLDVTGSFYASTADYVKLGEDGRFQATHPEQSILTVAPPSAFGFLSATAAPIVVQGSTLSVPKSQTLWLIGGNLTLEKSAILNAGEVKIQANNVTMKDKATIDTDNSAAGTIKITVTDKLVMTDLTQISSNTIAANCAGGRIDIIAHSLQMSGNGSESSGARINATTRGTSMPGGEISITTDNLQMADDATINTGSFPLTNFSGPGGQIRIQTHSLTMRDTALIFSGTFTAGNGGAIQIDANDLTLSGRSAIAATTFSSGRGGKVGFNIHHTFSLLDDAVIASGTEGRGAGGQVSLLIQANRVVIGNTGNISATSGTDDWLIREMRRKLNLATQRGAQVGEEIFAGGGEPGTVSLETDNLSLTTGVTLARQPFLFNSCFGPLRLEKRKGLSKAFKDFH
jgi:filamentous hemagglutinin family protein